VTARDELIARAEERGLHRTAALVRGYPDESVFEGTVAFDPRLVEPPGGGMFEQIGQLPRRGLDPRIVVPLVDGLVGDRALEAAAVAWDALTRSIFVKGDRVVEQLNVVARPIATRARAAAAKGAPPGIDLNATPAVDIVNATAAKGRGSEVLLALYEQALAHRLDALVELRRRRDALVDKRGTHDSLIAFGRVLALAHLTTWSALHLDVAVRGLGVRAAALALCEVLFDAGTPERIPGDSIQRGDLPDHQLSDVAEYLTYRSWESLGDYNRAYTLLEQNLKTRPRAQGSPSVRLQIVRAHVGTMCGERPVSLERVEKLVEGEGTWRYGNRAAAVVAAAQCPTDSPRPAERVHAYLTGFGNDLRMWTETLSSARETAGWKREAFRMIVRECLALPHEPAAWKPLMMFLGTKEQIAAAAAELDGVIAAQRRVGDVG
jgi:hypothetical protein